MQESKLLSTLPASSFAFLQIIQTVREKYQLPEVSPDGDPKVYAKRVSGNPDGAILSFCLPLRCFVSELRIDILIFALSFNFINVATQVKYCTSSEYL